MNKTHLLILALISVSLVVPAMVVFAQDDAKAPAAAAAKAADGAACSAAGVCPKTGDAKPACAMCKTGGKMCPKCAAMKAGAGKCTKCPMMIAPKLAAVMEQLDAAEKAVQAGQKDQALAAIAKAKTQLEALKPAAPASKPAVINTKCPMMGNAIDPSKVPANLYREYKGKGVGFCCGGCPAAWDKLTDAEKDAKLQAATATK